MKRNHTLIIPLFALLIAGITACGNSKNSQAAGDTTPAGGASNVSVPAFNADSAYQRRHTACAANTSSRNCASLAHRCTTSMPTSLPTTTPY